jgi:hypothetical protein
MKVTRSIRDAHARAADLHQNRQRPVVVSLPSVGLADGKKAMLIDADGTREFPKELSDGQSASVRISYKDLAEALAHSGHRERVRIWPTCSIETGEKFTGEPWNLDVREAMSGT